MITKRLKIRKSMLLLTLPKGKLATMKQLIDFAETFGVIRGEKISWLSGLNWLTACDLLNDARFFTQGRDELGKYYKFNIEWTA